MLNIGPEIDLADTPLIIDLCLLQGQLTWEYILI